MKLHTSRGDAARSRHGECKSLQREAKLTKMCGWSRPEPVFLAGNRARRSTHQRVSQPRCRRPPRESLQYPVHGPCVAALAVPGFLQADSQRAAPVACRL